MKTGDRVRYLNSVGGGIVQRFINKDMVSVLEDDGFETPTLVKECVVVENVNEKNNFPSPPAPRRGEFEVVQTNTDRTSFSPPLEGLGEVFEETPEGENLTVALAFVPQNVKKIQDTDFDLYLVNDSNYELYYSISTIAATSATATIIENGLIHLNTTLFLREVSKVDLNDYEQINVQFVAFKTTKAYNIKPAVNLTVKLNLVNFYKLHSFAENDYFDEPTMLVPVITNDQAPPSPPKGGDVLTPFSKTVLPSTSPPLGGLGGARKKIVVDLHIRELLDNTNGMPPVSLFEYQMKKFNDTLAEHKNKIGQQIIFVHGKGNGVLRKEIIKEIRAKYPSYKCQDASFREYGFGATMVVIRQERLPVTGTPTAGTLTAG